MSPAEVGDLVDQLSDWLQAELVDLDREAAQIAARAAVETLIDNGSIEFDV